MTPDHYSAGANGWRDRVERHPRLFSLLWAVPFMVFLAFPIAEALSEGIETRTGALILAEAIALGAAYLAVWLLNDPAPTCQKITPALASTLGALVLIQIIMAITIARTGGVGGVYMLSYVAAPMALLAPRRWLPAGMGALAALVGIETFIWPREGVFPFLTILMASAVCLLARTSIDRERLDKVKAAQELALSQERERSRISADLHDILGQTLTGITVKADLAGRLLDTGRINDARAQIDDLMEMSRQALTDVRAVVSANRTLLVDAEIESAAQLLAAAGVLLEVRRDAEPDPGATSTLIAHAIREGCANALHHARPSRVIITVGAHGVRIVNDGVRGSRTTLTPQRPGNGLEGLRERVGDRGRVAWRSEGDEWILDMEAV